MGFKTDRCQEDIFRRAQVPRPHSRGWRRNLSTGKPWAPGWFRWGALQSPEPLGCILPFAGRGGRWFYRGSLLDPGCLWAHCWVLSQLGGCSGTRTPRGMRLAAGPSGRQRWQNIREKSWGRGLSACICLPDPRHPACDINGLFCKLKVLTAQQKLAGNPQKNNPRCPSGDHCHCLKPS